GGFIVGIVLDRRFRFFQALRHAALDHVVILLILRLLVIHFAIGGGDLHFRQFSDLERAVPIFSGENRVGLGAFFIGLVGIVGAGHNPCTQICLVLDRGIQHRDRFVGFFVVGIVLKNVLVGFDRVAALLYVVSLVDTRFVLLVNDARHKDRRGLVTGIERQRTLGVLFRYVEMAFLVRLRRFVQLVLCSNLADE